MVTLSERSAHIAVRPSERARRTTTNPARRGPVILATDGASRSGAVVVAAQLLAARLDVPLEVVSVLEPTPIYASIPDVVVLSDPTIDEARRDAQETMVSDYVGRFSGGATPPRIQVRFGGVVAELSRFAREVSATMIVMGSAPHRRFRRVASGNRAAQVLHSAGCPVLSVPPTFAELPRTVVAAVVFGPASVRAAQAAFLVVDDGGTVVLTHILPPLVRSAALSADEPTEPTGGVHAMFDRLREELRPCTPAGVKIETRLIIDDAVNGILSSADHLDADLVAVGTHGQRLAARLLLGSVTETILHRTERPVLASPPPLPAEALELWRRVTGVASSSREQEWAAALDTFTHRNAGRFVMLEVDDPESGAHVASHGYALVGVTYEAKADRVEIMMGEPSRPLHHLTRSVLHPDAITMTASPDGGEVLDIRHGRGHTIAMMADVHPAVAT
jgi:nucleotide-binding universal stress UspA family protein